MVERYAHLGVSHVAAWASNIGGSNPVQVPATGPNANGPEGPSTEGDSMGWLMGLEPTTTGITKRSQAAIPRKIKHLRTPCKCKTG